MSAKFCLFIPSKVWQTEKRFPEKLRAWLADYSVGNSEPILYTLAEFRDRSDVNLEIGEIPIDRYHVLDFGFEFPPAELLPDLLVWLAGIYPYGEVGICRYWSDNRKRFPPIAIGSIGENIAGLSWAEFPLDTLYFLPLKNHHEPS